MADRAGGNAGDIPNHSASIPGNTRVGATAEVGESGFPDLKELRDTIKEVDIAPVERALAKPHGSVGRRPYPRGPMIRAFLSMPFLDIADISSLHRRLMNDPALRYACGFTTDVPSRPTFSRVFSRLKEMPGLMDGCHAQAVATLSEYLPDLGNEVAVDSTKVKTNSNRRREPLSDPEASWGRAEQPPGGEGLGMGLRFRVPYRCRRWHRHAARGHRNDRQRKRCESPDPTGRNAPAQAGDRHCRPWIRQSEH